MGLLAKGLQSLLVVYIFAVPTFPKKTLSLTVPCRAQLPPGLLDDDCEALRHPLKVYHHR